MYTSKLYLVKPVLLGVATFVESFFLAQFIYGFVLTQNFFALSIDYSLKVIVLMLLTIITFSLTAGIWNKWEQYLIIPLPVALGLLISALGTFPEYAPTIAIVTFLTLSYNVLRSTYIKNLLIKFEPKMILSSTAKGTMLVFSLYAGFLFLLQVKGSDNINLGKEAAGIANQYVTPVVEEQLNQQMEAQYGIPGIGNLIPGGAKESVGSLVETQVNTFLAPYQDFIKPLLFLVTFSIFQFYATIAYLLYLFLVDIIFLIAKKTGFIKVEKVMVEKEILKF